MNDDTKLTTQEACAELNNHVWDMFNAGRITQEQYWALQTNYDEALQRVEDHCHATGSTEIC